MKTVFITGGTGYIGTRLVRRLLESKYRVKALVRKGSEHKLPGECTVIAADPFDAVTFEKYISTSDIFIQLLGVSHPSPAKKELFKTIDFASVKESVNAALSAGVCYFVYVSVAQTPSKIMKDYQAARAVGETIIKSSGMSATFIRPWYVVGPGHYWPLLFFPLFKIMETVPATKEKAKKLSLVYLDQMLDALIFAIENPNAGIRVIEIEDMKNGLKNLKSKV
jgi:uncharacterized protein YbjT (DUF2867 family)